MVKDITYIVARNRGTLLQDALGVVALLVILFVGLSLPGTV